MKKLLLAVATTLGIVLLAGSCSSPQNKGRTATAVELAAPHFHVVRSLREFDSKFYSSPNVLAEKELRDSTLQAFRDYFRDSLNRKLYEFRVTPLQIGVRDMGRLTAFYAEFKDGINNHFWMEFDYKAGDTSYRSNPVYKYLKDVPIGEETTLNFFYMDDVKWDHTYDKRLRIRVAPIPDTAAIESR